LPHSQEPVTCPYRETDLSSPCPPPLSAIPLNIKIAQYSEAVHYARACLISHLFPVLEVTIPTVYASGLVFSPLSLCVAQDIASFTGLPFAAIHVGC
jgi:hypothetical protein